MANSKEEKRKQHLKHNLELKAQKQIRIHGGFQWDFFRDKETGEEINDTATRKASRAA